ncbi:MAG: insulinase family protein [Congregibacter sp.]
MFLGNTRAQAMRLLTLSCLLFISACAVEPPPAAMAPEKSPNDRKAYRLVTLENGLKALLVSSPDSPKAAASLDVNVGSGDNPEGRGGLAHFLEHMLFLGTDKYPDSAEYEQYISEHGGSRNAYTSFEHTNYYFDVDAPHLEEALDRFAQFFIAPKFDAKYVERERNAVQAEYQMGLKSDPRRGLDVLQASMNPQHPFSQFAVGSLDSLADREGSTVRDELIDFYNTYYSANIMRLVVQGRESLDELESMVVERFSAVPNRNVELDEIDAPLFVESQLPTLLQVKPQGTLRELDVNFQIPDYRADYLAKPMSYVSNLVGHEGEGSLLSALKAAGLADGLSSGTGLHWRGGALLSVTVSLTEQGVAAYEDVLKTVFAYLEMLRNEGPQRRIYNEQSSLAELAFRFREPTEPIRYVSALSNSMHYYSDEDILRGPYLMSRFDAELIDEALSHLVPERAHVTLTAPGVSTDRQSPYYEVAYSQLGPEAIVLSRWRREEQGELALPAPNPFIAEDVALAPIDADNPLVPELRVDEARKRLWFKQATDFRVPKGAMYLSFRSPLVSATAEQRAASSLYTRMVTDAVNEYTYPALLAGLGFNFYTHAQGISMRVSGYDDKQTVLLDSLLERIGAQEFDAARFERIRRDMVLELQNTVARRPTSQLFDDLRRVVGNGTYHEDQLIAALEQINLSSLSAYRDAFWQSARAEGMLYGNYTPADIDALADAVDLVLTGDAGAPALAPDVVQLEAGDRLGLKVDIEHDDALVGWYLQGSGQSWSDRASVALTAQLVQSGFFQQLRTEQQLGYIVQSFAWPQYDVPALMLLIQSPSHAASDVYDAMQAFLVAVPESIGEEQFLRNRAALVNDILKPHENLMEQAEFYWQSIAFREWDYAGATSLAAAVEAIDYETWKADFQTLFVESPRSIIAFSEGAKGESPELDVMYSSPESLREERPRYSIDVAPL